MRHSCACCSRAFATPTSRSLAAMQGSTERSATSLSESSKIAAIASSWANEWLAKSMQAAATALSVAPVTHDTVLHEPCSASLDAMAHTQSFCNYPPQIGRAHV